MALFSNQKFENLDDLLMEQVQDLYDAEHRLLEALPKMEEAATNPELKGAFRSHLNETKGQVQRLEEVFRLLDSKPEREACDAMKGLISESEQMVEAKGEASVRDAALIAAAQRVEHYEMAGYGSARSFARMLKKDAVADLLEQTLSEEKHADETLTSVALNTVNLQAARA